MAMKRCWLPNLFTIANLFCGFLAMTFIVHAIEANSLAEAGTGAASNGWFVWAGLTICSAALFDALDGRIARALRVSSPFGKELDSLADVVSFGAAPALLVYEQVLRQHDLRGLWMGVAGLFVCCGAARLARYNISTANHRFFLGMPIPAAGLAVTGLAIYPSHIQPQVLAMIVLCVAVLMISTLRYPNPEYLLLDAPVPVRLLFLGLFVVAITNMRDWFFLLPVSYMVYGLVDNVMSALRPNEA
jgi:CDP-diacylglycerol--serine O-phosphatidyltransferase